MGDSGVFGLKVVGHDESNVIITDSAMKYAVGVRCSQEKRASDRRALTGQRAGRRLAYIWADIHLASNRIIC
jgi:chromosome condensin MukBEF MukE localization factor